MACACSPSLRARHRAAAAGGPHPRLGGQRESLYVLSLAQLLFEQGFTWYA